MTRGGQQNAGNDLTVEVVLGRDGDVEKFFDVKIAADVCGGQLVVFVAQVGIVVALVRRIGGRAEPLRPLFGAVVVVARGVGGVDSPANLRIVENFAEWNVSIALGRVAERLEGVVVSAVESHVKSDKKEDRGITDTDTVVYTPRLTLSWFLPCVPLCTGGNSHVSGKGPSQPVRVVAFYSHSVLGAVIFRGGWVYIFPFEQPAPQRGDIGQ